MVANALGLNVWSMMTMMCNVKNAALGYLSMKRMKKAIAWIVRIPNTTQRGRMGTRALLLAKQLEKVEAKDK
jgi:hypothetical protein